MGQICVSRSNSDYDITGNDDTFVVVIIEMLIIDIVFLLGIELLIHS